MTALAAPRGFTLRGAVVASLALHVLAGALLFTARRSPPVPMPPTYRVNLIAAPPGPRQMGEVQPTPKAEAPAAPETPAATKPAPVARETPDASRMKALSTKTAPKKVAKVATPNAAAAKAPPTKPSTPAAAPVAGGGPTGGRGADVANVTVDGIAFPYPGYLENVVRQIALRFDPGGSRALTAVVAFLIRRDGTVAVKHGWFDGETMDRSIEHELQAQ